MTEIHLVVIHFIDNNPSEEFRKEQYDITSRAPIKVTIKDHIVTIELQDEDELIVFYPLTRIKEITSLYIEE